jgi:hypothetical protein
VAIGAPLPDAQVTLKDANGKTLTATADGSGAFVFRDITGVVAPLMLKATGTAGATAYTLYSAADKVPAASAAAVVNVTPITDSVVSQTLGAISPELAFSNPATIKELNTTKLAQAKAKLVAVMKEVLTALGEDAAKVDLFTTAFAANNSGLDKLLDLVEVQVLATETGSDIRLADKSSGMASIVSSTDSQTTVKPLPKPSADLVNLNTASVRQLLASFNALTGSQGQIQSAAMRDLFDPDFLMHGLDRAAFLARFWRSDVDNILNQKMLDSVIGACEAASKVCQLTVAAQNAADVERIELPVKQGSDGKWRFYGDRSQFRFEFKPGLQAEYSVRQAVSRLSQASTGVTLWIPLESALESATVSTSNDNGRTWAKSFDLKAKPACRDRLALDDGNASNCSNFFPVNDAQAVAANDALDGGNRKFKITGTKKDGSTVSFEAKPREPLFTGSSARALLARTSLGISIGQLGSSFVAITGKPSTVQISVASGSASGTTSWAGESLDLLSRVVSVRAANALCKQAPDSPGLGISAFCDRTYDLATGRINRVALEGTDPMGRGLWVAYSTESAGESSAPLKN